MNERNPKPISPSICRAALPRLIDGSPSPDPKNCKIIGTSIDPLAIGE
jgi:hypothetical protein